MLAARNGAAATGRDPDHRDPPPANRRWLPFAGAAAGVVALSAWGGQLGLPGATTLELICCGHRLVVPAGGFLLLLAGTWAGALATTLLLPRGLGFRCSATVIVSLAVLCRGLLLPHPCSDDVFRYLWEGRLLASGLSPYSHAPQDPADPAADHLRAADDPFWPLINHPGMTAIYPPLMELGFAVIASLWYSPLAVKLVMVACDLATLVLVLLLLRERRLDARWSLLYCLNPVILYSFAGQAHLDAVQMLLVVLALWLYRRRRWPAMFLVLGLAVQAKYLALFTWPLFLRRDNLRAALIAPLVAVLPALPFLLADGAGLLRSLLGFGRSFAFNGPVHWLLRQLLPDHEQASLACLLLLVPAWLVASWLGHPARSGSRSSDPLGGLVAVLGLLLLLLPTVHFWYLSILLPLVVLRPKLSWLVLSGTIALTFVATGLQHLEGLFRYPAWATPAVWALPVLLLAGELRLALRRNHRQPGWQPAGSVSVVIPVLDEEAGLAGCLGSLRSNDRLAEIIVVDGGSGDRTREIAAEAGCTVIVHDLPISGGGGRGGQITAGCRRATGDVVAILHADTHLPPAALDQALAVLDQNPEAVGCTLGSRFAARGLLLRLLELANDLRAALLGISFGDQVQLFRRQALLQHPDLVPDQPLMEDVELSLRLLRYGLVLFLWQSCQVSARRWRSGTSWKSLLVIRLVTGYLLRRLVGTPDTVAMYHRYYGPMQINNNNSQ